MGLLDFIVVAYSDETGKISHNVGNIYPINGYYVLILYNSDGSLLTIQSDLL